MFKRVMVEAAALLAVAALGLSAAPAQANTAPDTVSGLRGATITDAPTVTLTGPKTVHSGGKIRLGVTAHVADPEHTGITKLTLLSKEGRQSWQVAGVWQRPLNAGYLAVALPSMTARAPGTVRFRVGVTLTTAVTDPSTGALTVSSSNAQSSVRTVLVTT